MTHITYFTHIITCMHNYIHTLIHISNIITYMRMITRTIMRTIVYDDEYGNDDKLFFANEILHNLSCQSVTRTLEKFQSPQQRVIHPATTGVPATSGASPRNNGCVSSVSTGGIKSPQTAGESPPQPFNMTPVQRLLKS